MSDEPDVDAINLTTRVAVLDNDEVLPITQLFDHRGQECKPKDARSFVAGPDSRGKWYTGPTSAYITRPRQ